MSKPLPEMQPTGAHQNTEIQSIGLEFGPDFFLCYSFADFDSLRPLGITKWPKEPDVQPPFPQGVQPAFGLVHSRHCTLVPRALFREGEAAHWLHIATAADEKATAEWVHLYRSEAVMVYATDHAAQHITGKFFPGLQLHPAAGVLVEATAMMHTANTGYAMYLYGNGQLYYIVVWGPTGLLLLYSDVFAHHEDLRYYLLHCMRTLSLPARIPIYLLGEAAALTALGDLLRPVVAQVQQGLSANVAKIHPHARAEELSAHFTAFMAPLCAL